MKTKIGDIILIAITVIGLVVWKLAANKETMDIVAERSLEVNPTVPVRVDVVKYSNINNDISVDGTIHAENEVTLYSKIQGIVLKKYKKAGDTVNKGTVIAQVENTVVKEALSLAELNLANAVTDVERYKRLADAGAVTLREYEAILITHREAQRNVTELKDQLANSTLTSPINGILETDYFEEGTLLSIGTQVADFVDPTQLKAVVNITENEVYQIKKEDKVIFTSDIFPDMKFNGTVNVIASKGNSLLNYPVEIRISEKNSLMLKPGMYISARILADDTTTKKEMVIDRKAVIESLKNPEVYVIKEGKAYLQKISIGKVYNNYITITDGLAENDMVVVNGQINLIDGRNVQIIQ